MTVPLDKRLNTWFYTWDGWYIYWITGKGGGVYPTTPFLSNKFPGKGQAASKPLHRAGDDACPLTAGNRSHRQCSRTIDRQQ